MLQKPDVNPTSYREAMSRFAGAVHVITTDGAAGRRGITVIAACSVSDNPPTVLACLNRENASNECFRENGVFALNTLASGQQEVADTFSGLNDVLAADRFHHGEWDVLETGAPALLGALATFDCRIVDHKDLATHRVLFGQVTALRIGDTHSPLIYHQRGYKFL